MAIPSVVDEVIRGNVTVSSVSPEALLEGKGVGNALPAERAPAALREALAKTIDSMKAELDKTPGTGTQGMNEAFSAMRNSMAIKDDVAKDDKPKNTPPRSWSR